MSDQPSSREPLGDENRPRKGRTIDLDATEIKDADVQPEGPTHAQSAQPASAEEVPNAAAESLQHDSADASPPAGSGKYIDWKALIAGGLSGAVIAGALVVAGFLLIRDTDLKELGARVSRVEGQLGDARASPPAGEADRRVVEGLASRISKLEGAIAKLGSTPVDIASADRFSALESDLKALSARIGTLAQQTEGATDAAREARQRGEANAAALAELANKVATAEDVGVREKIAGVVRPLADRVGAVESALSKAHDASGRFAIAATALNSTIEWGQPFAPELAAVKSLGANPDLLAPLEPFAESGIPSPATLSRDLLALIPSLRAVEPTQGSFLTKLQANAEKLIRIRPEQEKEGTEVSAILDRIEIKAARADLAGAVAELNELPPAVRAPAEAWIEKAKARSAAVHSSQRLLAAALARLSK